MPEPSVLTNFPTIIPYSENRVITADESAPSGPLDGFDVSNEDWLLWHIHSVVDIDAFAVVIYGYGGPDGDEGWAPVVSANYPTTDIRGSEGASEITRVTAYKRAAIRITSINSTGGGTQLEETHAFVRESYAKE